VTRAWRGAVLLAIVAFAASSARAQNENPDLKSGKKAIRTAIILPVQASVMKVGMKGGEAAIEEGRYVETHLPELVAQALQSTGCQVLDQALSDQAMQDVKLRNSVITLQNDFNTLEPHLRRKPKDVTKERFTIGDEVLNLGPGASADALIFVRAQGALNTGGKKAFALLVGGGGGVDYLFVELAMVDSQTGEVLYYNRIGEGGNFISEPERLNHAVGYVLAGFTGPDGKKRHK
jgi:hypothetical protein